MFRSLLSCASIFVLLISTLFSPTSVSARRCGERMPETLLSLYRSSQFIYVGTFDRIEEGEISEDTAEYAVVPIKKYFSLSYSLKGDTKKSLVLEESEYRYKQQIEVQDTTSATQAAGQEDGTPEAEIDGESAEDESASGSATEESDVEMTEDEDETAVDDGELKPGDRVLLFLNKDEDSGELDLADYDDGLKNLSTDQLSSYEPRIRELNEIFSKPEPSYSEIVAWIVRCAEDPQTRWEGTYELLRSFRTLDFQAERAKEPERKTDSEGEQEGEPDRYVPEPPKKFDTGDENFAKGITEGQKLILTRALLSRKRPNPRQGSSSEDTAGLNRGDRELIEIVRRWGNTEVAVDLLAQLRYDSSDPNLNSDLMASIAAILADDGLTEIAMQYSNVQWRSDDEGLETEGDMAAQAANEARVDAADEPATTKEEAPDSVEPDQLAVAADPKKEQPKNKTYGEIRAYLMKKFLDRSDRLIAKMEKADRNE